MAAVGRALHDGLGQILSGVGLQLEALRLDYQKDAVLCERIAELQSNLEQAMEETRALSTGLNPSIVDRAGLHFALEQLVSRLQSRFRGAVRLHFPPQLHVPREIAGAFYRVAGYALEYALHRTSSSRIEIRVKEARGEVIMEIRCDGRADSSDPSDPLERVELLMLNRHAQRAGIPVTLESGPGQDTIVRTAYRAIK